MNEAGTYDSLFFVIVFVLFVDNLRGKESKEASRIMSCITMKEEDWKRITSRLERKRSGRRRPYLRIFFM